MKISIFEDRLEIDESAITEPCEEIRKQVREYEAGERELFDLDVRMADGILGDAMAAMAEIPYGKTRTYGEVAAEIDTAPIVVGQACGRNPVPLVVPCHRVVGSDGDLKGYSGGDGIATKRRLLDLESSRSGAGSVQTRLSTE